MDIFRVFLVIIILLFLAIWLFLYLRRINHTSASKYKTRDFDEHTMGPLFPPDKDDEKTQINNESSQKTQTYKKSGLIERFLGMNDKVLSGKEDKEDSQTAGETEQSFSIEKKKDNFNKIIAINLRARSGERFNGKILLSMFYRFNLIFGKMEVFHRLIKIGVKEEHVFSIINGEEPGTLKPEDLEVSNTHRIIFYITLHDSYNPLKCFDEMLEVAKKFAVSIDGKLYDDHGSVLSEQNINYHRDIIKDFLHNKKIASKRDN